MERDMSRSVHQQCRRSGTWCLRSSRRPDFESVSKSQQLWTTLTSKLYVSDGSISFTSNESKVGTNESYAKHIRCTKRLFQTHSPALTSKPAHSYSMKLSEGALTSLTNQQHVRPLIRFLCCSGAQITSL